MMRSFSRVRSCIAGFTRKHAVVDEELFGMHFKAGDTIVDTHGTP
jgi:hypothetical protein